MRVKERVMFRGEALFVFENEVIVITSIFPMDLEGGGLTIVNFVMFVLFNEFERKE